MTFLPAGALVRHRTGSARVAIILRSENSALGKQMIAGKLGRVEVLGYGQQVLIHGWHPADPNGGCRWFFPDGRAPWTVPFAELPVVPEAQVRAALQAISEGGVLGEQPAGRMDGPRGGAWPYSEVDRLRQHIVDCRGSVAKGVRHFLDEAVEGQRHNRVLTAAGHLVHRGGWSNGRITALMADATADYEGQRPKEWEKDIANAIRHARANEKERMP